MLRPTTLLRAFAAPSRLLLSQTAPSTALATRCFTTTPLVRSDLTTATPSASTPEQAVAAASGTAPETVPSESTDAAPKKRNPPIKRKTYGIKELVEAGRLDVSVFGPEASQSNRRITRQEYFAELRKWNKVQKAAGAEPFKFPEGNLPPPSNWTGRTPPAAPEPAARPDVPFFIGRTPSCELPVYHFRKAGGNKKLTVVKGIEGDRAALKQALAAALRMDADAVAVNNLTGHVKVAGHKKEEINAWLASKGF
ncbi:54S ribosomal protein img2, mitochondrial [Collariella sp. IMI 366227]|nr:54S ribosomal protein img2, mitochondrial [Collariella sp. IMI 366227]